MLFSNLITKYFITFNDALDELIIKFIHYDKIFAKKIQKFFNAVSQVKKS